MMTLILFNYNRPLLRSAWLWTVILILTINGVLLPTKYDIVFALNYSPSIYVLILMVQYIRWDLKKNCSDGIEPGFLYCHWHFFLLISE